MKPSRYILFFERAKKIQTVLITVPTILLSVCLAGCSDNVRLPTAQELIEFENASPIPPSIDTDRLVKAQIGGGPYRVVTGDALELTMPAVVRFITTKEAGITMTVTPYISRVNTSGNITLPIVGDIKAAGRTLPEIESDIIDAYYPKHVVTRPSVFARVLEYKTSRVSIAGAVMTPGIYSLRSDQMSLVALLMEAGGIIDQGATHIRIIHSGQDIASDEEAVTKTSEQKFTPPDGQNTILRPVKPATNRITANENEVPPFFRDAFSSSAIGALAIRQSEQKSPSKQVLINRLAWDKPLVSTADAEVGFFPPDKPIGYEYHINDLNNITVVNSNLESLTYNFQTTAAADAFVRDTAQTSAPNRSIRIRRITDTSRPRQSQSVVLPVKGFNIPFADIVLQDGDSVIVERLQQPLFTVMDLVNSPGNFPYPPDIQYTLMQAIGFAGGLNIYADPRYVTIYRLKQDGTCVSATFPIKGKAKLANASNTLIKPGDIIAVEHTPRTRTSLFLDRAFRISVGTYWRLNNSDN